MGTEKQFFNDLYHSFMGNVLRIANDKREYLHLHDKRHLCKRIIHGLEQWFCH